MGVSVMPPRPCLTATIPFARWGAIATANDYSESSLLEPAWAVTGGGAMPCPTLCPVDAPRGLCLSPGPREVDSAVGPCHDLVCRDPEI